MKKEIDRKKRRRQRGQGMTEYIIIVALIAIGTIGVITIFGNNIRALFGASANALQGQNDGTLETTTADGEIKKDISNFQKYEDQSP